MIKLSRRAVAAATAVLAFGTGSAALATASASAAVKPAQHNLLFIPRCAARQLRVGVRDGRPVGTSGTTFYRLEFRNDSWVPCSLDGWPGVAATDDTGQQLGAAAAPDSGMHARHAYLLPGGIAHALLGYDGGQVTPACNPAAATFLAVTAPHTTRALYAHFSMPVCTDTTSDLTIGVIRPGA